jgi:cytidylate kinase
MIITISGDAGAGKGSVGRLLAKKLNYKFYSMGSVRRKYAAEKGITLDELNKRAETDSTSDNLVDSYQEKLGREEDDFVLDSRLGFHFIPQSIKVYLTADLKERARRIVNDKRGQENYASVEEAEQKLEERKRSDQRRYKKLYNIECYNPKLYDLVVDTTKLTVKDVVDTILEKLPLKQKV